MSSYSGPKTIDSNLLFNVDAANLKSFSGSGQERIGGIYPSFSSWNGLVGTSTAYTNKNGKSGVYLEITNANAGGTQWWNGNLGSTICLQNTSYTITAIIKYQIAVPYPNLLYVRQYNSVGAQTSESGKFNSANLTPLGNDYYLTWATFTTDSTAVQFLVQGYEYQNIKIWLEDVKCKRAGLADIGGTDTQVDMNFTNGVERISANGGCIQFNAQGEFGSTSQFLQGQTSTTWEAFISRDSSINTYNMFMGVYPPYFCLRQANDFLFSITIGGTQRSTTGLANKVNGQWYHACVVVQYDGSANTNVKMYVNGVLEASNTWAGTPSYNGAVSIGEGRASSWYPFQGKISAAKVHNRALSDAEVVQNFNALRSRFGL